MAFKKIFLAVLTDMIIAIYILFFSDIIKNEKYIIYADEQKTVCSFSAESGFYNSDFKLSLSSYPEGEIYYTTDGSDPVSSCTSQLYTQPILITDKTNQPNLYSEYEENTTALSISRRMFYKKPKVSVDKSAVVRVTVKDADGEYSTVENRTYFITNGNLAKYKDMTVISLVTDPVNLFDADTGIYVVGNRYIDWSQSSLFDYTNTSFDTDNLTNFYLRGKEWERPVNITVFESGEVTAKQEMGIRIKGGSSRDNPQKSFNLYARSEYGASKIKVPLLPENYSEDGKLIDKYDSFCLRAVDNEIRLRDSFAQMLLHDRKDLATQDMKPCVLFLNGEYWGLYQITEKLSDYFIQSNYGIDKNNVAMIKNGELQEGTEEELERFNYLADSFSDIDLTDEDNYKEVCDFVDIDSIIEHYAAGLYLGTADWPNYNTAVWKNTGELIGDNKFSDGKWRFISFDFDYTMGETFAGYDGVEGYAFDNFSQMDKNKNCAPTNLFAALLKNKEFRNKFAAVYCDYANEVMSNDKINTAIEYYSQKYSDLIAYTRFRWHGYYNNNFNAQIKNFKFDYKDNTLNQIKNFFTQRKNFTLEDMKEYTGLMGTLQTITLRKNGNGKIKISSVIPDLSDEKWSGEYYSDCPVTLTALADEGSSFTGWSGDISGSDSTITVMPQKAMNIQADFSQVQLIKGDINRDGKLDASDIIFLKKYIFNISGLTDIRNTDIDNNGNIDIFDLCRLKREIIYQAKCY